MCECRVDPCPADMHVCKTQMVRCNKHGQCFLAHIEGTVSVFYFIRASGHECVQPDSQVGFMREEGGGGGLFPPCLKLFLLAMGRGSREALE